MKSRITIGISHGATYLGKHIAYMFNGAYPYKEIQVVETPDFIPDIFVASPLDGGCYRIWSEFCKEQTNEYAKIYSGALILLWSGEAWNLSDASGSTTFPDIICLVNIL